MRCEEVQGMLDHHLDGELTEEISRKIERHLLRCPACAYEARTLEQTGALLRESIASEEPSPGFRERALARLHNALTVRYVSEATGTGRQWKLPLMVEE